MVSRQLLLAPNSDGHPTTSCNASLESRLLLSSAQRRRAFWVTDLQLAIITKINSTCIAFSSLHVDTKLDCALYRLGLLSLQIPKQLVSYKKCYLLWRTLLFFHPGNKCHWSTAGKGHSAASFLTLIALDGELPRTQIIIILV